MTIVCQNCSARLQIDEAKVPQHPFSIRCPKCSHTVNSSGASNASPASEKSALSIGGSPSTDHPRFEQPKPAPLFEIESHGEAPAPQPMDELTRLLTGLLAKSGTTATTSGTDRPSWKSRQTLVCLPEAKREHVARRLAESGYRVFVAQDTRQAVECMRDNQLEVVMLDPEFDPSEQGAAFVTREVNMLRPAQRRRLFFGLISQSFRTLDAHSAFLNNVNVTYNYHDIDSLPSILDRALREFNELYADYNRCINMPAL